MKKKEQKNQNYGIKVKHTKIYTYINEDELSLLCTDRDPPKETDKDLSHCSELLTVTETCALDTRARPLFKFVNVVCARTIPLESYETSYEWYLPAHSDTKVRMKDIFCNFVQDTIYGCIFQVNKQLDMTVSFYECREYTSDSKHDVFRKYKEPHIIIVGFTNTATPA